MEKKAIVAAVVATLEHELAVATQAAKEAAANATDEESRQENKYDTRGLESSYVASAQAHYAKELKEHIQAYRNLPLPSFDSSRPVSLGAVVTTLSSNGRERFFIGPARGGFETKDEGGAIVIVTPQSPLGRGLLGKKLGARTQDAAPRTIIRIE